MRHDNEALAEHLKLQSGQGQFIDTGHITINPQKAREKLAKFALLEAGFWVLKIVQAAVACGAEDIRFTFKRKKVQIHFKNVQNWSAEEICQLIMGGSLSSNRALMHLQIGLNAAIRTANDTIEWTCSGSHYSLERDRLTSESCQTDDLINITATRSRPKTSLGEKFSSPIRHLFHQTAHEFKALVDHCSSCPIPVFLDTVELPRRYARNASELPKAPGYDSDNPEGLRLLFAVKPLQGLAGRKSLPYPIKGDRAVAQDSSESLEVFTTHQAAPDGEDEIQGLLCLLSCKQRLHELNLTLDGVLLERISLTEALTQNGAATQFLKVLEQPQENFVLSLTLEACPSQVDLSQFKANPGDIDTVVAGLKDGVCDILEILHSECSKPWKFTPFPEFVPKPADISLGGTIALAFLVPLIVPVGIGLMGIVAIFAPLSYIFDRNPEIKKAQELRARIDDVLDALGRLGNQPPITEFTM